MGSELGSVGIISWSQIRIREVLGDMAEARFVRMRIQYSSDQSWLGGSVRQGIFPFGTGLLSRNLYSQD